MGIIPNYMGIIPNYRVITCVSDVLCPSRYQSPNAPALPAPTSGRVQTCPKDRREETLTVRAQARHPANVWQQHQSKEFHQLRGPTPGYDGPREVTRY